MSVPPVAEEADEASLGASPKSDSEVHRAGRGEGTGRARPVYNPSDYLAKAHERELMRKYKELIKAQQEHKAAEERRAASHEEYLRKEAAHKARMKALAAKNKAFKKNAERRKAIERHLVEMREKELEIIRSQHAAENKRLLEAYQQCNSLEERQQQGLLLAKEKFQRRMEREQFVTAELAGESPQQTPRIVYEEEPQVVERVPRAKKPTRPTSYLPAARKHQSPTRAKPTPVTKRPQSYHPKSHNYNPNCSPSPVTSRKRPHHSARKYTSPQQKPKVRVPHHVVSVIEKLIDVSHPVAPGEDVSAA